MKKMNKIVQKYKNLIFINEQKYSNNILMENSVCDQK